MVRVGLIGCGGMGTHVARECHHLDSAEVVALFDPDAEAVERAAEAIAGEEGGGLARAGSVSELIGGDLDGVIVATPNDLHPEITIEAARAGKHIFCEKPMALSVRDCDRMIEAADNAGVKLMVGQVLRLIGPFWKTCQIVGSGELGSPRAMAVTRIGSVGGFAHGWRASKRQCGGILYEVHVHELDFMRQIMGEARSVFAKTGNFSGAPIDYEDTAFVQLEYENGGVGFLYGGIGSSIRAYDVTIQCERGALMSGGFGGQIRYAAGDAEPTVIDPASIEKEEPYREEVRSWVDAITQGTPMIFDGHDGRAAIALAEAAYLSAETGEPVDIPR